MKCFAGIVLYNPDIKRLESNINSIINQVSKILLVDNASSNINEIYKLVAKYNKTIDAIELIVNDSNKGIAFALNQVLEYSKTNKYPVFLTLDQDSICKSDLICRYENYFKDNIGQMTCNIIDEKTGTVDKVDWRDNENTKEVDTCITSGALNNTNALCSIGGYNNSLFIDGVDIELSLKLRKNNYKIIRINYDGLLHELGEGSSKVIFGKPISLSNHSPWRNYYARRNMIYIARKYCNNREKIIRISKQIVYALGILILENQKIERLKYNLKGIVDGFKMSID